MGSRASYIIIERAAIAAAISHWGAQKVPQVVACGPDVTLAYIRDLQQANWLYDTDWAEGGILLDADTHTLILWGGEDINYSASLRRLFLPVLRQIWQGWEVSWATHGIVDFAEYPGVAKALGIDPASVIGARALVGWNPYPASAVSAPNEHPWIGTIITVKWEDGRVVDYSLNHAPSGYLTYGPPLLKVLYEREPDVLPREDGDGEKIPDGGAYADVAEQVLWVWELVFGTLNPAHLARIAQAWPGWRVEGHADGLPRQVVLSGRDPALAMPPIAQMSAELLKSLSHAGEIVAAQVARASYEQSDANTTAFFPDDVAMERLILVPGQRRKFLARLIEQVAQEQAQDSADG